VYRIQQISDYPLQTKRITLPSGLQVVLTFYFIPMQKTWVIRKLVYDTIEINNIKIVTNPNILRDQKNILPFGISCQCEEDRDPQFPEDFQSDACKLYLLSPEEVESYEAYLSGS